MQTFIIVNEISVVVAAVLVCLLSLFPLEYIDFVTIWTWRLLFYAELFLKNVLSPLCHICFPDILWYFFDIDMPLTYTRENVLSCALPPNKKHNNLQVKVLLYI